MSLTPQLRINCNKLTRRSDPELSSNNQLRRLPKTRAVTWQWSIRCKLVWNYPKRKIFAQRITMTSSKPCAPDLPTPVKPSTETDALLNNRKGNPRFKKPFVEASQTFSCK